jgi:hypothetical protein
MQKSQRGNLFQQVQMPKVGSNSFDLSYDMKFSMSMGNLTPVHVQECVPGDVFTQSVQSLIRFAPMISPVMHQINAYVHFFFVPNRILWPNWETFITAGNAEFPPVVPYIYGNGQNALPKTVADYFGLPIDPTLTVPTPKLSALPFAAYQMIYNEFYRDENLIAPIVGTPLVDGDNNANHAYLNMVQTRAWEHDYFSSALPFAQKGDAVTIPIAGFGDVPVTAQASGVFDNQPTWVRNDFGTVAPDGNVVQSSLTDITDFPHVGIDDGTDPADRPYYYDPANTMFAKTSELQAQEATINDLRKAYRLQEWLERNARGGTRYIENILAHFGVKSSDARLQRPEYLGGSKQPVVISEVLQTSESTDTATPQGNMAGHGFSVGGGKQFNYRCEEHGWIIGIMSVLPRTAYQQGVNRSFSKFENTDYFWPSFAHLGEQEILNQELYVTGTSSDTETFGYTPRYAEYKYNSSRVAGDFRDSLAYWHMGRIFDSAPSLNGNFVTADPTKRIFAVTDPGFDDLYVQVFHSIQARRKMPVFGTPQT